MSWVYAFVERGENRYVKIGVAQNHYHERFEKSQQCNPVPIEIAATWQFPSSDAAKLCEREIKKGAIFEPWRGGGPEWFRTSPEEIHCNPGFAKLVADLGGIYHPPRRFAGEFVESLNLGALDRNGAGYRPHLYLLAERPSTGGCKIALSCYNWPTVLAHYMTYNPRALDIVERWSFQDEMVGKAFVERLMRQCLSRMINSLGWYRIEPTEMNAIISKTGALSYPRTSPIDDRVHYTKFRVSVC